MPVPIPIPISRPYNFGVAVQEQINGEHNNLSTVFSNVVSPVMGPPGNRDKKAVEINQCKGGREDVNAMVENCLVLEGLLPTGLPCPV